MNIQSFLAFLRGLWNGADGAISEECEFVQSVRERQRAATERATVCSDVHGKFQRHLYRGSKKCLRCGEKR